MIYFTKETTLPPFVPLPRFILHAELSINAKLLYGLILNRTMLSRKSGWYADNGAVYVIYTIKQMANDLNRSERTVKDALNELEHADLIQRVRQGWNRANRIFLKLPDMVQLSAPPDGNICPMDGRDVSLHDGQTLPPNHTDKDKEDLIQKERSERPPCFGEYNNVLLTDGQLTELKTAYPGIWEKYIEKLSAYMESTGKTYRNHAATIKSWITQDAGAASGGKYDYEHVYDEGECL